MEEEFRLLEAAARQMADALEQTATGYDAADAAAAGPASPPRPSG